jgi:hypothetical protein
MPERPSQRLDSFRFGLCIAHCISPSEVNSEGSINPTLTPKHRRILATDLIISREIASRGDILPVRIMGRFSIYERQIVSVGDTCGRLVVAGPMHLAPRRFAFAKLKTMSYRLDGRG